MHYKKILLIVIICAFEIVQAQDYIHLHYTPTEDSSFSDVANQFLRDNLTVTEINHVKENLWGNDNNYQEEIFKKNQDYYLYIPQESIDSQKLSVYLQSKNPEDEVKLDLNSLRKFYQREFVAHAAYRLDNITANTDESNLKMEKKQLYLALEVFNIYSKFNTKLFITFDASSQNDDYGLDISYDFSNFLPKSNMEFLLGSKLMHSATFKASNTTSIEKDESVDALFLGGEIKIYISNNIGLLKNLKLSTYYYQALIAQHNDYEGVKKNLPGDFIGIRFNASLTNKIGWFIDSSKRAMQGKNAINFTTHLLGLEYIF